MELDGTGHHARFTAANALKAAATYDAAADHFDAAPLGFWRRHGRRTVELADIQPGDRVLDVGCGTGASAVPAAMAAGPTGHVTGIDVAENLLKLAHAKARRYRLINTSFELADMTALEHPDQSFDAVISVFSIFFVEDMEQLVGNLWRRVRPGGRLAITVWAQDQFQPGADAFFEEVARQRPDIAIPTAPWDRLTDPHNIRQLFLDAETSEPKITHIPDRQHLERPDDFWTITLGSGFRSIIEQLTPQEQALVREQTVARLAQTGASAIETSCLCAVARRAN